MHFPLFALALLIWEPSVPDMVNHGSEVKPSIENRLAENDFPGIQYFVLGRDSLLFSYVGGWADVAGEKPMQLNTTMMIYSMTKTFTAAAVLQLVEQGRISLDDPVTKYVGGLPYGNGVTIRHLLSQTSGLPNPIPLKWVHLVEEHQHFDELTALQKVIADNPELDYAPGEKNKYSNISYWLLGRVIAEASGMSYEQFLRQNVFRRLGIPEQEADFVIPSPLHHAKGYLPKWSFMNLFKFFLIDSKFVGEYEGRWLHIQEHYLNGPAFGGIVASARSIGIFLHDQLQDSSCLFGKGTTTLFYDQQKTNDGEPVSMTLGWHIGTKNNIRYFFKEGGGAGFHSEMRIYPTVRLASVVIANNTSFDATDFLNATDGAFLQK